MRRIMVAVGSALLLLSLLGSSLASAAPKTGDQFELDCSGQTLVIAVPPPDADWTPGIIIEGGHGVVIPVALEFTVIDATGEILFQDSVVKPGARTGQQDRLTTCTFSNTFEEDGETFTFTGTVTVRITPRQ